MTIEELCEKLTSLISGLSASGFDTISDSVITELDACVSAADGIGIHEGKKLIENMATVLKNRKQGSSTDESVTIRLVALDFYVKKLQTGSIEDL